MNDVKPFRALFYNSEKIDRIGDCLSQPYDVITPAQQDAYYKKHEYNVVRLVLNRIRPEDTASDNRYTRARDFLNQWRRQGVLTRSSRETYWVYQQDYEYPVGRSRRLRGFIGLSRLQDYASKLILPHEKVMPGPIEDRMNLAQATGAQFEAIWAFYRDKRDTIGAVLERSAEQAPLIDHREVPLPALDPEEQHVSEQNTPEQNSSEQNTSGQGPSGVRTAPPTRHRLWQCADPDDCRAIRREMADRPIYIADGHHRYQTMLTLRDRHAGGAGEAWNYIMMFLVNADGEDMTILPYHRLLHNLTGFRWQSLRRELDRYFEVREFSFTGAQRRETAARWLAALDELRGSHAMGVAPHGQSACYLLVLKDAQAYSRLAADTFGAGQHLLDVNILNYLVLDKSMGITDRQMALENCVEYTQDADEALERVWSGEMQIAFILNATALSDIVNASEAGEVLPRKSSFFYPKPVSGLVIYEMEGFTT